MGPSSKDEALHRCARRTYSSHSLTFGGPPIPLASAVGQLYSERSDGQAWVDCAHDLDGWTVPDLINPDDINIIMKNGRSTP